MGVSQKYQDLAKMWRVLYCINDNESIMFKFNHNPTQLEIDVNVSTYLDSNEYVYRMVNRQPIIIENFREIIDNIIVFIKTEPTMLQLINYINNQLWYDSATIKFFVFGLAKKLETCGSIVFSNYDINEILGKIRLWVMANTIKKIRQIVWGNYAI